MAARRPLTTGVAVVRPVPAVPAHDPVTHPTDDHPRWRLRVFDRRWPWRATRGEAIRDALASRNARRDREERMIYLDACAFIQRDPPPPTDRWALLNRACGR